MEKGKIYKINHSRKGEFSIRVTGEDSEWLHGIIVEGAADAILTNNIRNEGEAITVRKSLCLIEEDKDG